MALVVFSYANPFADQLQLDERIFTIDDQLLRIEQAWKGDGKGGTNIGFGASVYPAAYVLAEYLERHPDFVRGKRVIELGTGTGFLGIAAAVLGAASVCLTDGDDASLRLAERNVAANLPRAHRQHPRARRDRPAKETCDATANRSSIACHKNNGINTTGPSEDLGDDYGVEKAGAGCNTSEDRLARVETGGAAGPDALPRVDKPSPPPAVELAGVSETKGNCAPPGAGALSVGAPSADGLSADALGAGAFGAGSPEPDGKIPSSFAAWGTAISDGNSVSVGMECGGGGGGDGNGGDGDGGSGSLGVENRQHHQRQHAPPAVSVRKLRWGFPDDMEACLGQGGPWEVVLGSDIAALPYASAHGDLLRTIAFLVNDGSAAALDSENAAEVHAEKGTEIEHESGPEPNVKSTNEFEGERGIELDAENSTALKGGGEGEDEGPSAERSCPSSCRRGGSRGQQLSDADAGAGVESGADLSPPLAPPTPPSLPPSPQQQRQPQQQPQRHPLSPPVVLGKDRAGEGNGRKVLVLLAHKRRHVCEEPFFKDLRVELGESSCREMGEGDVHPDFRGMGIRLLAFEVDVCRRASARIA